jgi:hypothetical protein
MDYPVSDALRDWLDRNGLGAGSLAGGRANGKGAGCADGGDAHPATALRGEEDARAPMGRESAGDIAPASAVGGNRRQVSDPSPARGRPVLRILVGSSRQRAAQRKTSAAPCLVLIEGGKR